MLLNNHREDIVMKKYINPELKVVKLKTQNRILSGSPVQAAISSGTQNNGDALSSEMDDVEW